ncbi:GerA spore germination protein [Bacillus sp. OV322]|uniref:spore germination protein n=1 Tax=Bacillus sp. OV322 TaxID=1882764 RepID=UPI0008EE2FDB|nr:spore germination protein [Bacillus sp. OV322]SFC79577.1 GerA spore germination protein [Bacillus sp. OV322]
MDLFKQKGKIHTNAKQTRNKVPSMEETLLEFKDCADLKTVSLLQGNLEYVYIDNIGNEIKIKEYLTDIFDYGSQDSFEKALMDSRYQEITQTSELYKDILNGYAAIFHGGKAYSVNIFGPETRPVNESGTETVITGPHEAFNESTGKSLGLIRRRVKSSHLKIVKLQVGEISKTDVYVAYIEDIVNMEFVELLKKRLLNIEIDGIHDSNMLSQMIDENPYSVFPQYLTTERPDSAASKLIAGKIIILMEGSPSVIIAPTSFFDFFNSPDDYYQRWTQASFLRILRYIAFLITVLFTAFYVSVTTYHYEMIPHDLLLTLVESRSRVPFPPLIEAIIMEVTIELLREAGARLPTKIGQTIGIVGGIVIGQSAVDAGFTSNILIVVVAISAISSFVVPSYIMSGAIRLIRFGIILLAGLWGNFGIVVGVGMVLIHMSRITNLGTSYLNPISPMFLSDIKDVLIRAPFSMMKTRPVSSRTKNIKRNKMKK